MSPNCTATTSRTTYRRSQRRRLLHELDHAAVVGLAAEGDPMAWEELVDRFGRLVYAVARRYRLSASDVDDVSQRVWLLLVTHVGRLRQPESLAGWLSTTTARECLKLLSRGRRDAEMAAAHRPEPDAAPSEDAVLAHERRETARTALARLSGDRRRLVEVVVMAETPYATAADELGMPVGSLGPTRIRCLRQLARAPEVVALGA